MLTRSQLVAQCVLLLLNAYEREMHNALRYVLCLVRDYLWPLHTEQVLNYLQVRFSDPQLLLSGLARASGIIVGARALELFTLGSYVLETV